ncbi:MAG: hypothetical protein ACLFS0_00730 [Bacteroidales bacterium]
MKKLFSFSVWLLLCSAFVFSQEPIEYPDAIAERSNSNQRYLTNDAYEKVRTFYEAVYGSPDYEGDYNTTFFYEDTRYEPRGIHIYRIIPGSERAKGVKKVFSELYSLVQRSKMGEKEILTEARYDEILNRYKHLQDYFYPYQENESDKHISEDEAIYQKYYKNTGHGAADPENKEEIMERAQQLIMAGRVEEGTALLEKLKNTMTGDIEYANSPKVVDSWVKCLEEMDSCKYQVSIRIDR